MLNGIVLTPIEIVFCECVRFIEPSSSCISSVSFMEASGGLTVSRRPFLTVLHTEFLQVKLIGRLLDLYDKSLTSSTQESPTSSAPSSPLGVSPTSPSELGSLTPLCQKCIGKCGNSVYEYELVVCGYDFAQRSFQIDISEVQCMRT